MSKHVGPLQRFKLSEVYGVYIGIEGIAERKNMAENAFTQVMFSFNAEYYHRHF